MDTNTTTATRWLAGFVIAAGLGTAIVAGTAVTSADTGTNSSSPDSTAATTMGPANDGASGRKLQEQVGVKVVRMPVETITAKPPQTK
jgi:hypothetical protein